MHSGPTDTTGRTDDRGNGRSPRTGPPTVVGLCGSLRADSYNSALLDGAIELAEDELSIQRWDSVRDVPPFDDDVRQDRLPDVISDLGRAVDLADGVLIATPEYNFGVPGVLKNVLDWLSTAGPTPAQSPLRHKPVAVMGASIGLMGTVRAQQDLRRLCHFTDSQAMLRPEVFVSRAPERFDSEGRLVDEPTRELLAGFVVAFRDFIDWARHVGPPPGSTLGFAKATNSPRG